MIDEHQPVSISGSNPPQKKYRERNFVFLLREEEAIERAEYSRPLIFNVLDI